LKNTGREIDAQVDGLSKRLDKAENSDANLDMALSADGDDADTPQNSASQTTSFASQIDTNAKIIGVGNGKTSATFNAAVNAASVADVAVANNVPAPVNRLPVTPAP
jgi:hypothetical protein